MEMYYSGPCKDWSKRMEENNADGSSAIPNDYVPTIHKLNRSPTEHQRVDRKLSKFWRRDPNQGDRGDKEQAGSRISHSQP